MRHEPVYRAEPVSPAVNRFSRVFSGKYKKIIIFSQRARHEPVHAALLFHAHIITVFMNKFLVEN